MNKISISIPVFNGEKYLKEAIESAIEQTQPADEILVFVHDTNDSSMLIAQEFGDKIKLIEENTNLNIGQAWNRLYELSLCDYVIMLHCDDKLHSNAVKSFSFVIEENPSTGMIFGRTCIGQNLNFTAEETPKSTTEFQLAVSKGFNPGCSGLCLHRQTMLNVMFNEKLHIILDYEFISRISCFCINVIGIPDILITYRVHENSTLQTTKIKQIVDDYIEWIRQCDQTQAMSNDYSNQYRGIALRRFASFYSSLIYDYRFEEALEMTDIWQNQISNHNQIYRQNISRIMHVFITISLIKNKYAFGFVFLIARIHRFLFKCF